LRCSLRSGARASGASSSGCSVEGLGRNDFFERQPKHIVGVDSELLRTRNERAANEPLGARKQ